MMPLDERELSEALRSSVPEPPTPGDRALQARRAARRIRRRQRTTAAAAVAAVVLAVGLPVGLTTTGGPSPAGRAVASGGGHVTKGLVPASPAPNVYCGSASCDPQKVLAAIRHPLNLPTPASGAACPTSPVRRFHSGAGFTGRYFAIGKGPLYLAGPVKAQAADVGILPGKGGWGWEKVIWVVSGDYGGPLLLRGARIDGSGGLRFDHYLGAAGRSGYGQDSRGFRQLLYVRDGIGSTAQHVRESFPSGIHVKAPGCYAIQVDGQGFSETLVFRAVR